MSNTTDTDVSYDPYDVGINADPYPVFRRLREEAPLYRNDEHDFYALSRFDDVERGLGEARKIGVAVKLEHLAEHEHLVADRRAVAHGKCPTGLG